MNYLQKFPDYLANILFIFRGDKKFIVNSPDLWTLYFKDHDKGLKKNINF